jgi:hypothetical protein
MQNSIPIRHRKPSEAGYMLLAAMFLLFLLALSLSIAAPMVAKSIQRDREVETMERGKQYRRAIQLYYWKFHAYPPNIDALVKTNNIRFLRKRYIDPMTGKDDWQPILFGQNKTPLALGFFGEPLAGGATAIVGTGPGGGNSVTGSFGSQTGINTGLGSTGSGSGPTSTLGGSLFNSPSTGSSASGTAAGSGQAGTTGTTGGTGSSSGSTSSTGLSGQTFGGAGIVGFEPASPKTSILTWKKKNHYNEWEFTYSPLSDQQKQSGGNAGTIGQPAGSQNGGVTNSNFFGGNGGNAGSTTNPTTNQTAPTTANPTQPQQ